MLDAERTSVQSRTTNYFAKPSKSIGANPQIKMPKIDTTVANLVSMIRTGELRLPDIQRQYVWPTTRVRDLLDSLYRGYPSGTILVWETDREMPTRDLAVKQEASPFLGHKLLLDGQQRLTSLSAILRGEPVIVRNRKKPIEVLFNLDHPDGPPQEVIEVEEDIGELDDVEDDEEADASTLQERLQLRTFVVASKALQKDKRWVKVSEIFKGDKSDVQILKSRVSSFEDPRFDRYSKRLQAIRKIGDYPYVMHVLDKDLSYEEVAEIFVRVNSLGMKLRGSDLALAQITSRWRDSLKLFETFQEECEDKWFTLDLGLIVRTLVVFATGQSKFKTVGGLSLPRLQEGWEKAKEGLRFAVNFLRANAGIEDESLLSSPYLLITLGYYAIRHGGHITEPEEKQLRRWLYIANARGHYSRGSSEGILDADLSAIARGGGTEELLNLLTQQLGRLHVEPADFAGRGQRSPLFAMAYLALKNRGAKDWRTRLALSLTHQGRLHFIEHHHIFPKVLLKKAGRDTSEINEIANLAFVSGGTNRSMAAAPPDKYFPRVLEEQGEHALTAHCISLDPEDWKIENYTTFLERRRSALADAVNRLLLEPDRQEPQVDVLSLITKGESDTLEFKASARWDAPRNCVNRDLEAEIVKTVAGFANSQGGTLLIGVQDNGTIIGVDNDYATLKGRPNRDGYEQFLTDLLSRRLGKNVCARLKIAFTRTKDCDVCLIQVPKNPEPVYTQGDQDPIFYVRVSNSTRQLNAKEAVAHATHHWN